MQLVSKFREKMGGTVAALDTIRQDLMEDQWGDCPPGAPIPCDLIANGFPLDDFRLLADFGGRQCASLDNMVEMNRMIVMLIFESE
ncbi:MAG: hypothetical protein JRF34_03455 [Deltaproteobacteria bacterium]|nr:hypothetical protein [Deltaproteobacteria bacterium]